MLLAAGWTWPAVTVIVVIITAFTVLSVVTMASRHVRSIPSGTKAPRLDAIEDDLVAIRADLADIKESLAELDRMFKSVG